MTSLGVAVEVAFPQELVIRVRGADALRLESRASPDEEAPIPDLGELFVRSARAGLFGGAVAPPWAARAEVLVAEVDPAEPRASWRLRLDGLDPGSLRIMWNVLLARELDEASMVTVRPREATRHLAEIVEVAHLPYPGVHGPLPFQLEVEPPDRSSRDRAVQIVFQRPPPDAVVDEVLAAFGLWTELLLLGGYPEDGMDAHESGAFPDPPFQLDEVTVEQAFPEHFAADEAAFHAIVNHALLVHRGRHAVAAVHVR